MSVFDRIATSRPVNRQAAFSTSRGDHYEGPSKEGWRQYDVIPRTMRVPRRTPDYTGRRFGRLTTMGLVDAPPEAGRTWLVRCVCGGYEGRSDQSVRSADKDDKCASCRHTQDLRRIGGEPRRVEDFLIERGIRRESVGNGSTARA